MAYIIVSFQADSKYYEEFNPKEEIAKIILEQGAVFIDGDILSYTTSTIIFNTSVENPFNTWSAYLIRRFNEKFSTYPFHYTIGKIAENDKGVPYFNDSHGDREESERFKAQIEGYL